MEASERLTMKERMGYGLGSIGESVLYIMYSFYALFFLTDVAGINTVAAGTIISASMVINAVYVIYLGNKSDNCRAKSGRRLPFMKAAVIPAFIFTVMCFSAIELPEGIKTGYYTVAVLGMLIMHTTYVIPYEALGSELTSNLQDRNSIRNYAKFFMGIGTFIGLSLTAGISDFMMEPGGLTLAASWQITSVIIMAVSFICMAMCIAILKDKATRSVYDGSERKKSNILKEYVGVMKIGPFKYLLLVTAACSVNFAFSSPAMIYYMTYNMGLPGRYQSIVFVITTVANIVFTPITAKLANMIGKERAMIICYIISGVGLIAFSFSDVSSVALLGVLVVISTVGNSAYYQLIFPMYYDMGIIDEHDTGRKRVGTILSLAKTVLKIGTAVGTQLLAVMLALFGYNEASDIQSDTALMGIRFGFLLVPGILYLASAVFMKLYPVTEEKLKKISASI